MAEFLKQELIWTRKPERVFMDETKVEIITECGTDLWQRTYYGFQNDNAPVLQTKTADTYFSFTVRTRFESKHRFDQCGVAVYLDSENWLKASVEYENEEYQRLGSVATNHGYSDWATMDIPASVKEYVKMNFPQEIITKIERGRSGVEVELANDYSLKFNKKGQFVSMDD